MKALVLCILIVNILVQAKNIPCQSRNYKYGIVCVCNDEHCDTIEPFVQQPPGNALLYTSSNEGARFAESLLKFGPKTVSRSVIVDRSVEYQKIIGFGGAFTDATGININSLSDRAYNHLLNSYFSTNGLEYSLGRVPIGGTDFSTHGYSYADGHDDASLNNFALAPEDSSYKIPIIKKALEISNENLDLFASAWIAPKWMKTNGKFAGFGFLKKQYYQTWADYMIKFLEAYKALEINFWAVTTGNEPSLSFAGSKIPSVGFEPSNQMKWVRNNLGPTIRKSQFSNIKIIAVDDQRFVVPIINKSLKNNATRSYIDGIGIHWYWNNVTPISWLTNFHNKYPDLFILGTEACEGSKLFQTHVELGSWARGENYADDIIKNLQHWMTGWVDWNMALDLTGGPTYINNNVDSPIIVNATGGEFYKQPMFYAIGHFSKFLPKQSVRIEVRNAPANLKMVAFKRPDNAISVIILNKTNKEIPLRLYDEQHGELLLNVTPRSINSILYW